MGIDNEWTSETLEKTYSMNTEPQDHLHNLTISLGRTTPKACMKVADVVKYSPPRNFL